MNHEILKTTLRLGTVAIICGIFLVGTYWLTHKPIAQAREATRLAALQQLVSADLFDNNLLEDIVALSTPDGNADSPLLVHRATKLNSLTAVIFEVSDPNGYSGPIKMLVAIHRNGQIIGIRILEHRETPGLGDVMESDKSDWLQQFHHRDKSANWAVTVDGGDFDAMTGATVTSRSVVNALAQALLIFADNRHLFQPAGS